MKESVLIISGIYPPDTGGPATFSHNFSKWLSNKNINVTIVTYTDESSQTKFVDSVKIVYVQRHRIVPVRYFLFILSIFRNYNPSMKVLATGAFLETMAASIARDFDYAIKIPGDVVWERARNSNSTKLEIQEFQTANLNLAYRIFRKLFTLSILKAKKVIVPSLFLQNLVRGWVGDTKNISLVYNSIDVTSFLESKISENRFDVITACRLVPWKGVDELIESCSELNLSLGIAGEGPDKFRLAELAATLGASVTFLGQLSKDEISNFYASGRIFALNSSYEGLPHALIEAKASGLLCIGRSGTGSEEVIRDMIDGLLVTDQSESNLKETLAKVSSNPLLVAGLRDRARQDVINRFDHEHNFQKIYELLVYL